MFVCNIGGDYCVTHFVSRWRQCKCTIAGVSACVNWRLLAYGRYATDRRAYLHDVDQQIMYTLDEYQEYRGLNLLKISRHWRYCNVSDVLTFDTHEVGEALRLVQYLTSDIDVGDVILVASTRESVRHIDDALETLLLNCNIDLYNASFGYLRLDH